MLAPTPFFSDRGCHIRILNSYLRLRNKGGEITLLTYPLGRNIGKLNIKRVVMLPGYKKTAPGFSFYKPPLDLLLLFKAFREMRKYKYGLVYAHLHEGAFIGIILKKFFRAKLVFDAQGSLVGELTQRRTIKKNGFWAKLIFQIEKYIAYNVDEIITSTDGLKKFMRQKLKSKKPINVVKDFPEPAVFNPRVKPARLKLPKSKKVIVYLGGLQKYKGINYLLRAIPHADKKAHFLIMGYPIAYCQKMIKKLKIKKRVTLTGKIPYEKTASYLKLGDLAIAPKTLESKEANAKIYNYLAMGLKVVCFDIPENREILGKNGIYAKNKDYKDLARKINSALKKI